MKTNKATSMGLASIALAAWMGCGSSVVDESQPSGGSGGSGGSGTGGDTVASSGTGGACAGFADQDGVATVTLHVRNDSPLDVYLPGLCGGVDYTIAPVGGPDGASYTFDGSCLQTCESLQQEPPFACGACQMTSYKIPAGGSRDIVWQGTGLRTVEMPAQCFFQPDGSTSCGRIASAPAGSYRVEALGYGACQGEGDAPCACDADGQCVGMATGMQAWLDPVKFDFPGAAEVDVVFGICAFGCSGGGDDQ